MVLVALLAGVISMIFSQWLIFFYAPLESNMGLIQKIFYLHLPLAWWALVSFFLVFCGSLAYLLKKKTGLDNFCRASCELGVLFSSLALLTGMIWAKISWGAWWTWDPRLSSTLAMWFLYSGYLAIGGLELPARRKAMIRAVLGIAAFLDIPLVFFSARLFRSMHPAVFASEGGGLEPEMKITAIVCAISLGLLWYGLIILRKRQLDAHDILARLTLNRNS